MSESAKDFQGGIDMVPPWVEWAPILNAPTLMLRHFFEGWIVGVLTGLIFGFLLFYKMRD
jgi:hypothetical protein